MMAVNSCGVEEDSDEEIKSSDDVGSDATDTDAGNSNEDTRSNKGKNGDRTDRSAEDETESSASEVASSDEDNTENKSNISSTQPSRRKKLSVKLPDNHPQSIYKLNINTYEELLELFQHGERNGFRYVNELPFYTKWGELELSELHGFALHILVKETQSANYLLQRLNINSNTTSVSAALIFERFGNADFAHAVYAVLIGHAQSLISNYAEDLFVCTIATRLFSEKGTFSSTKAKAMGKTRKATKFRSSLERNKEFEFSAVTSYKTQLRSGASLKVVKAFKRKAVKVDCGVRFIKFLRSLDLQDYFHTLHHLTKIMNGEPTTIFGTDNLEIDCPDAHKCFMVKLSPSETKTTETQLEKAVENYINNPSLSNKLVDFDICHKEIELYANATEFCIKKQQKVLMTFEEAPGILEVMQTLLSNKTLVLDNGKFVSAKVRFEFVSGQNCRNVKLLSVFRGPLFNKDLSFVLYKMIGNWYKIDSDTLIAIERQFSAVISDCFDNDSCLSLHKPYPVKTQSMTNETKESDSNSSQGEIASNNNNSVLQTSQSKAKNKKSKLASKPRHSKKKKRKVSQSIRSEISIEERNSESQPSQKSQIRQTRENDFNSKFKNEPNYVLGDCKYGKKSKYNKVEICDIMFINPKNDTPYLYHVKEEFRQKTRDACSQISCSARLLLFEKSSHVVGKKDVVGAYHNMLREDQENDSKIPDTLEKFKELLSKAHYVYAFADTEKKIKQVKQTQNTKFVVEHAHISQAIDKIENKKKDKLFKSLTSTSQLKTPITDAAQAANELIKQIKTNRYLLDNGSVTAKLMFGSKTDFVFLSSPKNLKETVYDILCDYISPVDSLIAKMELIDLYRKLQSMGYGGKFHIVPISYGEDNHIDKESKETRTLSENNDTGVDLFESIPGQAALPIGSQNKVRLGGIQNLGNTCYINVIIHLLYECQPLREDIMRYEDGKSSFCDGLKTYFATQTKTINTGTLQDAKTKMAQKIHFSGDSRQQDAMEFLEQCVDALSESVTDMSSINIVTEREAKCHECNLFLETKSETDYCLRLPCKTSNIQTLINEYVSETLKCSNCLNYSFIKGYSFIQQPDYLVIQLMRFNYEKSENSSKKLKHKVDCTQFITLPGNGQKYKRKLFIVHTGNDLNSGHYIAGKYEGEEHGHDKLIIFNDNNVKESKDLEGDIYIYLYKKCELTE